MNRKYIKYFYLLTLFFLFDCGVKSDPLPPEEFPPPSIVSIKYSIEGDKVKLEWDSPTEEKFKSSTLSHYNLFKASYSKESFCDKCPINYKKIAEVQSDLNYYFETLHKDRYYFYKITVVAENGLESESSETIKFDY
ncbi:MAG: hypothetical protein GY714_02100 [Desulfobacterales bacterium]|nr:hypothetical protein [Desulfobacterales bacterium]MCP4160240.1 hypothetical protein [Deltaproteobacteria bacterium]